MSNNKQILFNSRLIISDHFTEVINRLNDHVNNLVSKLDSADLDMVNKTKDKYIHDIKLVEKYNLDHVKVVTKNVEQTDKKKILDSIKRDLIKVDCFLLRNVFSHLGYALIITDWYVNSENIAFLQ